MSKRKSLHAIRGEREPQPNDGRPYYCNVCGAGWADYLACDEWGCELESEGQAMARQVRTSKPVEKESA